jgi:redox-sensitive bicupin YhaK (pirin superfamily)
MTQPTYHAVKRESIESIPLDGAVLRLLAGRYVDENGKLHQGFVGSHLPLDYYELAVEAGHSVEVPVDVDHSVLAFTLGGPALIGGLPLGEKAAVKLVEGNHLDITATGEKPSVVLLMSSVALHEPIAWGGPIVMNSAAELNQAFRDLDDGTFIREGVRSL